jgi:hypothetical protein
MHSLDPVGTRDLVKEALEAGSKEVKVVAIECLGADDLSFLIEQASAKAQEVRLAAYGALAAIDHHEAVAALVKAASGKDLEAAAAPLRSAREPKLVAFLLAEARREHDEIFTAKDKKEVGAKAARLRSLLSCLHGRTDPDSEALVLLLFNRREKLAMAKGEPVSGWEVNSTVIRLMLDGTTKLRAALADAHAELSTEELAASIIAAQRTYPTDKVYEMFSPYLTAKVDEKKKGRDPAFARREVIVNAMSGRHYQWWSRTTDPEPQPSDPRWLDLAVSIRSLGMVRHLARPGHAGANKFLKAVFEETFKTAKSLDQLHEVVAALIIAEHSDAADAFVACYEKHGNKAAYYAQWFARLAADLPKSALPKIEAMLPKLNDRAADALLGYVEQLRAKA